MYIYSYSNSLYGRNHVYTAHVYTYAIPKCNTDRNRKILAGCIRNELGTVLCPVCGLRRSLGRSCLLRATVQRYLRPEALCAQHTCAQNKAS